MKKFTLRLFLLAGVALLLSGCLDYEVYSLVFDPARKTGEMTFIGIGSNESTADQIEADFQGLIDTAYNDKPDSNDGVRTLSKKLYASDGKLNAAIQFQLKNGSYPENLEEIGLQIDNQGDYIFKLDSGDTYMGGNGQLVEQGSIKTVKWPGKTKTIEIKTRRSPSKDMKTTSLLTRWLEWKKKQR
ncbi:MAG: hypothetical protein HZB33_11895 [Nitrospirae bacterium]|nr:hypothetical protein [Nitrospirota bacterium]